MSTSVYIRRFIYSLKPEQVFTTKDVLQFGSRRAVDCALRRLVEKGIIRRLTSGVFQYGDETTTKPPPIKVAAIKAKAYGKKLMIHGNDVATRYELMVPNPDATSLEFWVDGASSSFRYGNDKIVFQSANKRKMRLIKKGGAGLSLAALWHIGRKKVTKNEILRCMPKNANEKEQLKTLLSDVPQWLLEFYLKKLP